jgi:hypothetical protein
VLRPVIRRLARFLCLSCCLPLAACGYFSSHWPTLEESPIPERTALPAPAEAEAGPTDTPRPSPRSTPIASQDEAATRLADYETRLSTLRIAAETGMAALEETPQTPEQWGRAQLGLSRLARTEGDIRILRDDATRDADYLDQHTAFQEVAARLRTLALRAASLLDRVAQQRTAVQAALAGNRPEDVAPAPSAPALPAGMPALTITADAEPEAYSQAVTTLVEKAQAINSATVYHVVAAPDAMAAERARGVRSLLQAGGVAEGRVKTQTDPEAASGSVRIFVE